MAELPSGCRRTILSPAQVRMILRIYWTDKLQRREIGKRCSRGLLNRIAKQFGVSVHVIKKITDMTDAVRRRRFASIRVRDIKYDVQHHLKRRKERNHGTHA